mmetsp:Transcript_6160/g.15642  ORF Transcript_6160/g.15642 Transcript_6160/m.15642 type:complete len:307 (-) Transcript_6160:101-1021(-)
MPDTVKMLSSSSSPVTVSSACSAGMLDSVLAAPMGAALTWPAPPFSSSSLPLLFVLASAKPSPFTVPNPPEDPADAPPAMEDPLPKPANPVAGAASLEASDPKEPKPPPPLLNEPKPPPPPPKPPAKGLALPAALVVVVAAADRPNEDVVSLEEGASTSRFAPPKLAKPPGTTGGDSFREPSFAKEGVLSSFSDLDAAGAALKDMPANGLAGAGFFSSSTNFWADKNGFFSFSASDSFSILSSGTGAIAPRLFALTILLLAISSWLALFHVPWPSPCSPASSSLSSLSSLVICLPADRFFFIWAWR